MDDYVSSFNNEDEAIDITVAVRKIQKAAGFDLRGFLSNSKKVASTLNRDNGNHSQQVNMNLENSTCDKILGMVWDTGRDEFKFQLNFNRIDAMVLERKRIPTKRSIRCTIHSVSWPTFL